MKTCWICEKECDRLSKEHIIPRFFGGIAYTENFSCQECNQVIGQSEQQLSSLSVFMHYMDNAVGEPDITVPKRGSRNRETRTLYGENSRIELTSTGNLKVEGWERPAGKISSEYDVWIPTPIPISFSAKDLHNSMLKAISALACYCRFPRTWLAKPLEFLSGNQDSFGEMTPVDLGLPPEELFAAAWIFSPPSNVTTAIYGAVAYGPIGCLYPIRDNLRPDIPPFFIELRAYRGKPRWGIGQEDYSVWCSKTLKITKQQASTTQAYRVGPFLLKDSQNSNLSVLEASPALTPSEQREIYVAKHPLESTLGQGSRFGSWLNSISTEEKHRRFLYQVAILDSSTQSL